MTYEQMRLAVIIALREYNPRIFSWGQMHGWAAWGAHEKGILSGKWDDKPLDGNCAGLCDEVVWDLACEGVLAPVVSLNDLAPLKGTPGWMGYTFRLTGRGRQFVGGDDLSLHDRDGYLMGVQKACAGMACAPTAMMYAEEAIRAYHARLYLAASFLVGAVTDAAVNDVMDAFLASDLPTSNMLIEHRDKVSKQQINARFTWFQKALADSRHCKSSQPSAQAFVSDKELGDWQAQLLEGLAHSMTTRNAAGHPERTTPTRASCSCVPTWDACAGLLRTSALTRPRDVMSHGQREEGGTGATPPDDHLAGLTPGAVVGVHAPGDDVAGAWDGGFPIYRGPAEDGDPERVTVEFPDGLVDQVPRSWVSPVFTGNEPD